MKRINPDNRTFRALALAAVLSLGTPVKAEQAGFTLEESIRAQIFTELKSNVQSLYRNSLRVVPVIDTSNAAKVASRNNRAGFALPANVNNARAKQDDLENIN